MICVSWDQGPIPNHPVALAKAMGLSQLDPPFADVWRELEPKWTLTKKGWISRRLEKTRHAQDAYRERRRKAGRKGAEARYGSHSNAMPELEPSHAGEIALRSPISDLRSSSSDLHSPPPEKIKPFRAKNARAEETDDFRAFYKRYPRHTKRDEAWKAWAKLHPDADLLAAINRALDWQTLQPHWKKEHGRFIPHPASWLNSRRWEDEPFHTPQPDDDPNDAVWDRVLGRTHGNR